MTGKTIASHSCHSPSFFEYELYEGDPDHLRTVVATPNHIGPWIDPSTLKLRHRIGRGQFGDVWLATYHNLTNEYDVQHEVAVKMLHLVKADHWKSTLEKFGDLFSRCQGLDTVCHLHGITIMCEKICIVMKFYQGSIGDKMNHHKGGKLPLSDVIRYGINLAEGILKLHTKGILVLNLKPFNFLLTENDDAIIGDFGIPYLLLRIPLGSKDTIHKLGSPNYMAPEQWKPEVRGPISFETDSWGFGCCILEMLTGVRPWNEKSVDQISHSVVTKQEKPHIPSGLPSDIENIIFGCFMYDFRSRPLISDILRAFKSFQIFISDRAPSTTLGKNTFREITPSNDYTKWFLSKDNLQVGDTVRSRKASTTSYKSENMSIPNGTIVGLERDHFVLVRVHGIHDPLRVHTSLLERVTFGLSAGDWVHIKEENKKHSSVGVLHCIDRDGNVTVGFIGAETLWKGKSFELHMAESYHAGQFVRIKASVLNPRFKWPRKNGDWATGRIKTVLPNGCLCVKFSKMSFHDKDDTFLADPSEVEAISFSSCHGMVETYEHLENFHWAVRPIVIALGIFTVVKLGLCTGRMLGRSKVKRDTRIGQHVDGSGQPGGKSAWFCRPSIAGMNLDASNVSEHNRVWSNSCYQS